MNADDFHSQFETLELDKATLEIEHSATITPDKERVTSSFDALQTLPEFRLEEGLGLDADFRIIDTLGEGGMGIVSLAEQLALRRMVAVKIPRGDNVRARSRLLEEAFILGRMEHPNVVPAYGLGLRADGAPMLVMKRVEGTSWEDLLTGRKPPPADVEPDLAWNLRVLLQVCNALRFAHARGVVHRDIKPENVMIGDFGEVYLLDWGIALSLRPEELPGFPTATTSAGLAGTPAFMAPEMTNDDPSDIDERTDVYLLGATLHMLLTGSPPHSGKSLFEVCFSAYRSEPFEYADGVSRELGEIASRAMARDKEDRFATVSEFVAALEAYIEHRSSYMLSDAAQQLLDEQIEAGDAEGATNRLLEAEFGFRQALTIWDQNATAQRGLQAAVEQRVRSCLAREEIGGARAALEQLPTPNPVLLAEIDALDAELAARAERVDYLERFEQELDLKTGTRSRQRAVIVLGIGFAALCFWQSWQLRPGQPVSTTGDALITFWRLALLGVIGIALFWRRLFANIANRRLLGFFGSALVFMLFARVAAYWLDASIIELQATEVCIIGMAAAAIGISSSRRLAVLALIYGVVVLVGAYAGQIWVMLFGLGVAHTVFFGATAWLWRPSLTREES